MKIDYQKWDKNGRMIVINGKKYVVAPEDLIFEGDGKSTTFWHQEDARQVHIQLACGWSIPTREQMICIVEEMKAGGRFDLTDYPYWIDCANGAYSPRTMRDVPVLEINEGITCRIRCICALNCLME